LKTSFVLERLFEDHAHIAKVLDFISDQAQMAASGKSADLEALTEAAEYLADYTMHFHHPLEDALCDQLTQARPATSSYVDGIRHEHTEVGSRLKQFRQLISDAWSGQTVTQADFASAAENFVAAERAHMNRENTELFPAAKSVLKPKDWEQLEERMPQTQDPLFGRSPSPRLGLLRRLLSGEG
jgi:hemerythrin-like domain-containing protein